MDNILHTIAQNQQCFAANCKHIATAATRIALFPVQDTRGSSAQHMAPAGRTSFTIAGDLMGVSGWAELTRQ